MCLVHSMFLLVGTAQIRDVFCRLVISFYSKPVELLRPAISFEGFLVSCIHENAQQRRSKLVSLVQSSPVYEA